MNEPEIWPKVDMTEFEHKLLDAAKGDRVPSELALRMASALSAPSIAPAASASALGHGGLLFSKAGLWGFLSLALLAGAGAWYAAWTTRAGAAARVTPPASMQAATTAQTEVAAPTVAVPSSADAPTAAANLVNAATTSTRDGAGALREEIELLDRTREALRRGQAQRAWGLLDLHRRRFAHGTLVPEAEALRIETLVRLGATERAQRMARQFSSEYPAHPLRERVSALTK